MSVEAQAFAAWSSKLRGTLGQTWLNDATVSGVNIQRANDDEQLPSMHDPNSIHLTCPWTTACQVCTYVQHVNESFLDILHTLGDCST
ncbi:hypothetical protein BAUCODRAFT_119696 [Baudoinia panamericana UAMH 10762]|uniref:Uncharacterized protein n=1 Tax=Baudoinia panamericana (strain UAMH 10762) TaxID=717646 RepID=M2MTC5_BAUPA|nr:uncharacterized protein BAUCODRAFT_119696 [Baudoinia panamericana UAMH 10762]EMD00142.1 hypothetical protein BAUCODRAFT_119696 [Baudoinia panamericana UAMH 10762]